MIQLFFGPDTYAAREEIGRLAKELGASIRWLERADLEERSLADWIGQSTGLFGKELPVVRDPWQMPKSLQEDMANAVGNKGQAILWERGKVDKRVQLWKIYGKKAKEFYDMPPEKLELWLAAEAKELKGEVEPAAAKLMVRWLGADKWRLKSEMERLLLINEKVSVELVEREVDSPLQAEIFAVMDALTAGDNRKAVAGVEAVLAQGFNEFYVMSMLHRQVRLILLAQEGSQRGMSAGEIARQAGMHPFPVEKSMRPAQRLSRAAVMEALTRIAASDFAIKQGRADARTAVVMLTMGLADLCRRQPAACN